jgi:hypothetical protein
MTKKKGNPDNQPADQYKPDAALTSIFNVTITDNIVVPVEADTVTTTVEGFSFFYVAGELREIFAPGHWSRIRRADPANA